MIRMIRRALLAVSLLLTWPAGAQQASFFPVTVTPNLAVSALATAQFLFDTVSGSKVEWVWIKNDCVSSMNFDLRYLPSNATTDSTGRNFPILLHASQEFSGPFVVHSVAVSNNENVACTFSLQAGTR